MKTDNPFTGVTGVPIDKDGKPLDIPEERNFYVCDMCGQSVDMRDLGQVFHHEQEVHVPLTLDA